jgi:hypothetical protein
MKRGDWNGGEESSKYVPKKPRHGEDSPDISFEEELMMMEEAEQMEGLDNFIDFDAGDEGTVSDDQSHRWSRPAAPAINPTVEPLGNISFPFEHLWLMLLFFSVSLARFGHGLWGTVA